MKSHFLTDKLIQAGLEEKEALIYAYIVQEGGAYPSTIAEQTKLNRSTVYKILGILSIRGIIGEIKKEKKLFYFPEPGSKFLRSIQYKVSLAEEAYKKAERLVPEIEGLLALHKDKTKVTFYEGKDAVIDAYITQVDGKGDYELCAFASTTDLESFLPPKVFRAYIHAKKQKRISARGIIPGETNNKSFVERTHRGIYGKYLPIIRYVPRKLFPFEGEVIMYQNSKVQFVKFDKRAPVAVIIEDKMIHDMMKMVFELAWNSAESN